MSDEKKAENCEEIIKDNHSNSLSDDEFINNENSKKKVENNTDDLNNDIKNNEDIGETEDDNPRETRNERKKIRKLEYEIENLKKQLDIANSTIDASKDKYLRMLAEYDNFRKRSVKEKECSYTDAYADAVALILPVIDNLERATKYSDAESVTKGIELMLKNLCDIFDKLGIKTIDEVGVKFDPSLHNAVMHIEDENYDDNLIVEVLQKGYIKGDRVIRYAMVKVAN